MPECFVTPKDSSKPYHNDKSKIHGVLPDLVSIEDRNSLEVDGVVTDLSVIIRQEVAITDETKN